MKTLLCLLPIFCVAAVRGPAWLASIAPAPVADTSLMWVSTNWLQFGTNLNTGTTATNDLSVTVSNAGTGTLSGSASTASPFSVIGASSYAISGTDTTNIVVRYTRSGEQTDTNELALTGGGGTNVHLSGRSTNAPGGPDVYYYGSAGSTPANSQGWNGLWQLGDQVTCTQGGSLTKIGVRVENQDGSNPHNLVIWLFKNSWAYHECGVVAVSASYNDWIDFTLVTPLTVGASENVRVMCVGADANLLLYYGTGTGGYFETTKASATCDETVPSSWTADVEAGVRVYVD